MSARKKSTQFDRAFRMAQGNLRWALAATRSLNAAVDVKLVMVMLESANIDDFIETGEVVSFGQSREQYAALLGVDEVSVRRAWHRLLKAGIVRVHRNRGRGRTYKFAFRREWLAQQIERISATGAGATFPIPALADECAATPTHEAEHEADECAQTPTHEADECAAAPTYRTAETAMSGHSRPNDCAAMPTTPLKTSKTEREGTRRRPQTPLPSNWAPDEPDIAYAKLKGYRDTWITDQAERFRDFHLQRATLSADWHASWRTWVQRAADFAPPKPPPAKERSLL
jgi:hypothetical protein